MVKKHYIKFWGDYGLFTNPLHPVERQTYPIPTHAALRNMIGSIYWHPELHLYGGTGYQITRVAIKKAISTMSLTRNEVTEVIKRTRDGQIHPINVTEMRGAYTPGEKSRLGVRTQRNSVILRDLEYIVEFYINFPDGEFQRNDDDPKVNTRMKYENCLTKRLDAGIAYKTPYFGCKEFTAYFEKASPSDMTTNPLIPNFQLTTMFYEIVNLENLSQLSPLFTTVNVKDGIITYPLWSQVKNS